MKTEKTLKNVTLLIYILKLKLLAMWPRCIGQTPCSLEHYLVIIIIIIIIISSFSKVISRKGDLERALIAESCFWAIR